MVYYVEVYASKLVLTVSWEQLDRISLSQRPIHQDWQLKLHRDKDLRLSGCNTSQNPALFIIQVSQKVYTTSVLIEAQSIN